MAGLALIATSALLLAASSASAASPGQRYSAAQVRSDLRSLYATMQEAHFNLYARTPKGAYDAHVAGLVAAVEVDMPKPQAHLMMQRLLAFGRVAHARTDAAVADGLAYVRGGGRILPINVRIVDGRMILDEWAEATGRLPPGSEILGVNRVPVADLYEKLRTIVSADTDRLLHAQVEQALPIYLHLLFGSLDKATVDARLPNGETATLEIAAVDHATMKALGAADPVKAPVLVQSKREHRILGNGVAYLRPGPFGNLPGEPMGEGKSYDPAGFDKFLTNAFENFAAARSTDLIIDLRGNPGGDNSFSDLMVARIANRPFRFASRFQVKASAATKAQFAKEVVEPGTLMAAMVAAEMRAPNGSIYAVELPLVAPQTSNRFDGKLWVLIDRHSFSNAAVVAALIQDYRFGTLIGEATADLATTFGSVEHFNLPHSGITIAYPKSYLVRPSGDETVAGVQPDIALEPQPVDDAVDRILEAALTRIQAARGRQGQ
ncbi:S41 family peptidase [Sphingomonas sp.]|uniref:S41 family peptidase n=1 Tax=Sphingomonas sp. TaxID=28214 RepID=UPI00286D94B1|nr:S41 family peptidase [Sphingomonas sp.]